MAWLANPIRAAVLLGLLLTAAPPIQAQTLQPPRPRQGYWVGCSGVGAFSVLTEEGRNRGLYAGGGVTLRAGQLLTERLGLGVLLEYGAIQKGSDKGSIGGLILEGSARLWRGLSAHTGVGFGFVGMTDRNATDKSLRGGAGAYTLAGVSYDFFPWHHRASGGWALTPTLDFHAMPDGNIHAYTTLAGLQITWWSGLPANKLATPDQ